MNAPFDEADEAGESSAAYPGLPRSTMLVAAFAIVLAGAMTFVILKWSDSRTAAGVLRGQIAELEAQKAGLTPELSGVEGQLGGLAQRTELLDRGKLAICNFSSAPVTVKMVAATWLGEDGAFHTYNSSERGLDLWRIAPGKRLQLDDARAGWDGSVTYYSLWIKVAGQEYPYAGTWPAGEHDCVLLT